MFSRSIKNSFFYLILICSSSFVFTHEENSQFEKIFKEHFNSLPNLDKANPKLLIMFSGTPGMGKTTVAKKLEDYFQGLRLSTDEIRIILKQKGMDSALADDFFYWCLKRLSEVSPNHLFIFDCSIDRKYDICQKIAYEYGYEIFLIRMKMERNLVEERIRFRNVDVEGLLNIIDICWNDYEKFGEKNKPNFIFNNNVDYKINLEFLLEEIEEAYAREKAL